ncbi:hypothetical protein MNBD_GAMMA22-2501 [hydrothermal vent metagenome]|uniref:Lipoprotein n=1 Tax=hydrothermal vent metagenome TaxID=652676 RepID=A0A3B1B019_9ZZZZ
MFSNKLFRGIIIIAVFATSLSLVACGGGESNTVDTSPVSALDPILINNFNAALIAKQGYTALTQLSDQTTALIPNTTATTSLAVVNISNYSLNDYKLAQADALVTSCTGSGSRSSSDPTVNPIIISYVACVEGNTSTTGTVSFDVTGTIAFTDLQITDNTSNITVTLNGSATVIISSDVATGENTFTFKGTLLSVKKELDVVNLQNFNVTQITNINTQIITLTIDYSLSSSLIVGSLNVETINPFKTTIGMAYPFAGQLVVTAAQGSKVRLTVNSDIGNNAITLDIDPDGTGYDPTLSQPYSWEEFF